MRDTRKSAVSLAGAGTLAVLLATSAFAQDNPRDGRSRQAWHGQQPAAAQNNAPHNQAQVAPQPQQAQANLRDSRSGAGAAQPNRQYQTNRGYDATRNAPSNSNGNWGAKARETAGVTEANRGYQPVRGNDPARNNAASNSNGNWNTNGRESARATDSNRGSRDNGRVTLAGRVSSFTHEGNGYRVRLDRDGRSFWIPESRLGNRGRDLRVGVSISLGGIFRGGMIDVDAINWPGNYGYAPAYGQGYVSGVVERVDYRTNTILLRDETSGSVFNVDMRGAGATSRIDARNLRPGDYLTLSGQWDRGGLFEAYRVDSINTRTF